MNILALTRPICPPWDEASKNFAYLLSRSSRHTFHVLTTQQYASHISGRCVAHPIFSSDKLNTTQKIHLVWFLLTLRPGMVDAIHTFFTPTRITSLIIRFTARRLHLPVIQSAATISPHLDAEAYSKAFFGNNIIVYSDTTRRLLTSAGINNVTRIYPAVDRTRFTSSGSKELRNRLGVPADAILIGYPGEYARLEAHRHLKKIITDIIQPNPRVHLALACRIKNDDDRRIELEYRQLVQQLGLTNQIHFINTFDNVADALRSFDVCVFPVESMGGKFDFPLVLVEAATIGCPIVVSDIPQLSEFANITGAIKVQAADPSTTVAALLSLLDQKKRSDLSQLHVAAANVFDSVLITQAYDSLYDTLHQ